MQVESEAKYRIYIKKDNNRNECTPFIMPRDVFTHKEYPTCSCGRKYVPIRGEDKTRCFFCIFTRPKERVIIKPTNTVYSKVKKGAYCRYCSNYIDDVTPQSRGNTCVICSAVLKKQREEKYRVIPRVCAHCNGHFKATKSSVHNRKAKFCTRECANFFYRKQPWMNLQNR